VVESRVGDVGKRLVDAVIAAVQAVNGRYLIAELADEPALTATLALLRDHGFAEVGRIPDFYRDGVPLVIARRNLP
jgi:L-amino acid N-acyltransferase YncA